MNACVQARCPGCGSVLRIPAEWVGRAVRCKHCGKAMQAKPKAAAQGAKEGLSIPAEGRPATQASPAQGSATAMPQGSESFVGLGEDFEPPVYRRHKRRLGSKILSAIVGLLGMAALAGGVYWGTVKLTDAGFWGKVRKEGPDSSMVSASDTRKPVVAAIISPLPRRALAICVSDYLYAGPVSYGNPRPGHNVSTLMDRFARTLSVSPTQITVLSDAGPDARPPLKPVIEQTVTDFLDTSRAQDRIIILFVGHAVEIGAEAYLVPIEGELNVKESLIPLKWLYAALGKCKASQKALIMDVCRAGVTPGSERTDIGPMDKELDAALSHPPAGVQVWSACVAGQYSCEEDGNGIFLDELFDAIDPTTSKKIDLGTVQPGAPFPLEKLAGHGKVRGVDQYTKEKAAGSKRVQTPRLSGQMPAAGATFNPDEPMPKKLVIRPPPAPPEGSADRKMVEDILREMDVPSMRAGGQFLKFEMLPPFSAKVLADYKPDAASTPLRDAIHRGFQVLREPLSLHNFFVGANTPKQKAAVLEQQKKDAAGRIFRLEEAINDLTNLSGERDKESSKRWRAHYDYVLAELKARYIYMDEYNYMWGQVRKDALPERDPARQSGFRLVATDKIHTTEMRRKAAEVRKAFQKLAKVNPGTPWAVAAKRESRTPLGLEWQAAKE